MSDTTARSCAIANIWHYDSLLRSEYIDGAPHIKHKRLRKVYLNTIQRAYEEASRHYPEPRVLDLGAGEGSVTYPFLELGANVTAVDISTNRLKQLKEKCGPLRTRLTTVLGNVFDVVPGLEGKYDIAIATAFLHHIPDYLALIRLAQQRLSEKGQFIIFQETMRYDTVDRFDYYFSKMSYYSWRICKGQLREGFRRFLQHRRGILRDDPADLDNVDYHLVRGGVDQQAIAALFDPQQYDCQLTLYFSTMSRIFQPIGDLLRIKNTFAFSARRR